MGSENAWPPRWWALRADHSDAVMCPECGDPLIGGDAEVESYADAISMWGDDQHDLCCQSCGADFIVDERVTREWAVIPAKRPEAPDAR